MSQSVQHAPEAIVGEPEVVEDEAHAEPRRSVEDVAAVATNPSWLRLKETAASFQNLQVKDGSVPEAENLPAAQELAGTMIECILDLAPLFPHDVAYLDALVADFRRWAADDFGVPDFYNALMAFQPQLNRVDGLRHLVVFPMYTQNGSTNRHVEAVLIEVIWPEFVAELEAGDYSNKLFVPIRFIDFTPGYDTNAAVLFPETVAMRQIPTFTWGAIFADREAARFRRVVRAASETTKLDLPDAALELLDDQKLTEETFVMWDLIHDRTHMRGDLPFDPFMIKQRMPYFLYSLEEMRCDMTAFRESVKIERALLNSLPDKARQGTPVPDKARQGNTVPDKARQGNTVPDKARQGNTVPEEARQGRLEGLEGLTENQQKLLKHARLVQYTVIFDRIFRFALTGNRVRNYDGLGGQLLFAWLHQHHVLHWTDTKLTIDWPDVADVVIALGEQIDELYWRSIDRPKVAHWLAAYELVTTTLTPNPASVWAKGPGALPLDGPPKELTNLMLDDEFPLSMFYEALAKKMTDVIGSTSGITATSAGTAAHA